MKPTRKLAAAVAFAAFLVRGGSRFAERPAGHDAGGSFAGKENVEFEIRDPRRTGDTITGKLVITSGGQTLFILKFTATPAVTA